MTLFHFIPVLVPAYGGGDPSESFHWTSILFFLLWLIPFVIAFVWHRYHDHKHNHSLEKRLDEVIRLLKKMAEK